MMPGFSPEHSFGRARAGLGDGLLVKSEHHCVAEGSGSARTRPPGIPAGLLPAARTLEAAGPLSGELSAKDEMHALTEMAVTRLQHWKKLVNPT
jgi:hypothetical protein